MQQPAELDEEVTEAAKHADIDAWEAAVEQHLKVLRTGSDADVEASEDVTPDTARLRAEAILEEEMAEEAPTIDLGSRWYPLRPVIEQVAYLLDEHRYVVCPAGRRSGKSEIGKRRAARKAAGPKNVRDPWVVIGAPTLTQAKRIFWRDMKALIPPHLRRGKPQEVELTIPLYDGTDLTVTGMDEPARIEGRSITHILLDEYGNMKEKVWSEHVQGGLGDHKGSADFIGTPEGRNHYYNLYRYALESGDPEWAGHTWTSEQVLDAKEIESMKRRMDAITYRQEILASFETFSGAAYYCWSEKNEKRVEYNPAYPLILCFDFNVEPGVAAVIQETTEGTCVIGEVYIDRESNTDRVCDHIIKDWAIKHRGQVLLYGDATGGNRGTSKTSGSDWAIIKRRFGEVWSDVRRRVPPGNPRERARINSVNARLQNANGEAKLFVDPVAAPNVVKDFQGVMIDPKTQQIHKKLHPKLSHISDAIGYYIHRRWPIEGGGVMSRDAA